MAEWSSSLMLQSLGWATLNSFWQFALIWCFYLIANHYFQLSSNHKYQLAVSSILIGLSWFIFTFIDFCTGQSIASPLFEVGVIESDAVLPKILTAASAAYLSLLFFPAYRILRNWNYIQKIKKRGLHKANLSQRLFVQKISGQLGIGKKVLVYVSSIVNSPVTIGYLKPIILLPVASFNNLTVDQTEAILLHELSHIRRNDYLVNLLLTLVHGLLYFNPFVKFLVDRAERERENCCDELVLQFQYDKVSYASALLELEKTARDPSILALAAASKNHLLSRIEKIVGIAKKPSFERVRFAGAFLFLIIFLAANTMMISGSKKFDSVSLDPLIAHFSFFTNNDEQVTKEVSKPGTPAVAFTASHQLIPTKAETHIVEMTKLPLFLDQAPPPGFMQASFIDAAEAEVAELDNRQNEQVTTTLARTKKVLETVQWKEMEKSIGDAMSAQEKLVAKQQYLAEISKLNWTKVEQKLKQSYDKMDWQKIDGQLTEALTIAIYDSVSKELDLSVKELCKVQAKMNISSATVMPDVSVKEVKEASAVMAQRMEELKTRRARPIVSL